MVPGVGVGMEAIVGLEWGEEEAVGGELTGEVGLDTGVSALTALVTATSVRNMNISRVAEVSCPKTRRKLISPLRSRSRRENNRYTVRH